VGLLKYCDLAVIGNLSQDHAQRVFEHYAAEAAALGIQVAVQFENVWAAVGGNPFHIRSMVMNPHALTRLNIGKHDMSLHSIIMATRVPLAAEGRSMVLPRRFTLERVAYNKALEGEESVGFDAQQLREVLGRVSKSLVGVPGGELKAAGVPLSAVRNMAAAHLLFARPQVPIVKDEFCGEDGTEDLEVFTAPSKLQWWAIKQALKVRLHSPAPVCDRS
jgi:hypothetical protein